MVAVVLGRFLDQLPGEADVPGGKSLPGENVELPGVCLGEVAQLGFPEAFVGRKIGGQFGLDLTGQAA